MAKAYIYRADEDDVLWMHDYPAYVYGDPVTVSDSATEVVDPATSSSYLYEFYFIICNQDTSNAVVVDIGVDLSGDTTNDFLFVNQLSVAAAATADPLDGEPILIDGDAQINAVADNPDDAVIFWRLKRVRDTLIDA